MSSTTNHYNENSHPNQPSSSRHRSLFSSHRSWWHGIVSGQLPIDPATGEFAEGDIQALTHQSLTNLKHVLEAAGLTLANVVKTTVFLADLADFAAMNEVYATYFSAPFPARSAVAVKTLPKNARVEIECIAVR